jgi:site-specific DNA recombinase
LPLRGFLTCCKCGGKLTGSNSKSRNGSLHSYYHCQKGCKERFRADEANEIFIQFLRGFEICEEAQELYSKILADVFKANDSERNREKKALEGQIEALQKRIDTLDDKYFDGLIDDSTYKGAKARYEASKSELTSKHIALQPEGAALSNYLRFSIDFSKTLSRFYNKADFTGKQQIIGSIFPDKLIFEEKKYRTTQVNEAMQLICNVDKAFSEAENKKAIISDGLSTLAPPVGLEPMTL